MHITSTSTMNLQDHLDQKTLIFVVGSSTYRTALCISKSLRYGNLLSHQALKLIKVEALEAAGSVLHLTQKITQRICEGHSQSILYIMYLSHSSVAHFILYILQCCMSYYTSTHFFSELPHLPLIDRITYFSGDDQP